MMNGCANIWIFVCTSGRGPKGGYGVRDCSTSIFICAVLSTDLEYMSFLALQLVVGEILAFLGKIFQGG